MPGFERPRKRSSNKDVGEKYDVPIVKPSYIEITNALNALQNLCFFHEVGNDVLGLLQKFESLHVHDTARKQSSILTYFNRK